MDPHANHAGARTSRRTFVKHSARAGAAPSLPNLNWPPGLGQFACLDSLATVLPDAKGTYSVAVPGGTQAL